MFKKREIAVFCIGILAAICITVPLSATFSDSPVATAAQHDNTDAVRLLLKRGLDVNLAQADGMTALHWAALNGNAEIAQMLLYAGANINAPTRVAAYTPLLIAAKAGNPSVARLLLKNGAEAVAATSAGLTAVMLAARSGNAETVGILLDYGADPNASGEAHAQTPLMLAAALNFTEVVNALIARGADPGIGTKVRRVNPGRQGDNQAGQGGNQARDDEPPPVVTNLGGLTALHYAAREGQLPAVRALLDGGANVNQVSADNTTPLLIAATNGQFDLAMYLLERGADPKIADTLGTTPIYAALNIQWAFHVSYPKPSPKQQKTTHVELIKKLLERGADPNVKIKQELWWTSFGANGGVGSGINEVGATPFWRAAQSSDIDTMRLLVAAGADPTIPNEQGITPLSVAAGWGYQGNVNVNSPAGWMPAVRYLVEELGVNVNVRNRPLRLPRADSKDGLTCLRDGESIPPDNYGYCSSGTTPLHAAAWRGDNEMILYLLSKGADVTAVSDRGQTVADLANGPLQRINPFPDTVELLVNLGSKNSNKCVSC